MTRGIRTVPLPDSAQYSVYPNDAFEAHRAFIARRRALRPAEGYRTPTAEEWGQFLGHFEKQKLSVGICGRKFGSQCIHAHACIRCSLLRPELVHRTVIMSFFSVAAPG